jgi:hypothetical protein
VQDLRVCVDGLSLGRSLHKNKKFLLFFIGFACATLVGSGFSTAHAQAGPDPQAKPVPGLTLPGASGRAGQATRKALDTPTGDADGGTDDTIIPRSDPTQDPLDPFDDSDGAQNRGVRAAPVDGDPNVAEPEQPVDGVLDSGQDTTPPDGIDPVANDLRSTDERDLFSITPSTENPAGYDPLLFQIEDLDPVARRADRRTERLFRNEPYDPLGLRIGSFIYFPEIDLSAVATNNVLRASTIESDDRYVEMTTNSRLVSNWNRHALEFRARTLTNWHDEFPSEDDKAYEFEALGRIDIAKRTNLQGSFSHDVRQEGRGAIDASTTGDRPDVTTDEARLSLNHRFNRLGVQLRGSSIDQSFTPTTTLGVVSPNSDRNSVVTTEAVRATWEFKPTFSVFGEVELDQRRFEAAPQGDNILRNSDGVYTRVGIDFGSTSQTLRGDISLGVGTQTPDDERLSETTAFLVDGNLAWRFSDLTSLLVTAQTDIFDTTTANTAFATSHTGGIELRHKFREYLIGTAGFTFAGRTYEDLPLKEEEARTTLGLEYFANRNIILYGRYQHIAFDSNEANSSYSADDVRVGVRVRQ